MRARRWDPTKGQGDVLSGVHVPVPEPNPEDPDAVLSDVSEEVDPALRKAEVEELFDDLRHLRADS